MNTPSLSGQVVRRAALVCLALAAVGFQTISQAADAAAKPEGVIAFASLGPRHWDLYAWRDGGAAAPITGHVALDFNAAISPDGKQVAFVSTRDGNLELYTMHADGSEMHRLTTDHAMDDHPTWSPDGSRIAFVSTREPAPPGRPWNRIYVMDADGSHVRRLSPEDASDFSPAWSPDGGLIAFTTGNGGGDLHVMKADGGDRRLVVRNGGWPTFIENGQAIAFHRQGEGNQWDVWKVKRDGSGLTRLVEDASMPRATFDGLKLAFVKRGGADQHIGILDVATGNLRVITEEKTAHWNPAISPDGVSVIYHRTRPGLDTPNVERWEAPSGTRLTMLRLNGAFPAFSPDHRRIALLNHGFSQVDVMNLDGSERKTLFKAGHRTMFGMSWSAEPEQIAFSHGAVFVGASITVNIKTVSPDGGEPTDLTADAGNNGFPSYSPDGKQLVIRSGRDGAKNLYIMDRDGRNVRRLTEGDWTDTMSDWSPTGEWIAFASDRDDNFEIWMVRPDGTGLRKQIGGGGRNNHPIFSPDGQWIVFTSQRAGLSAERVSRPSQPQPYGDLFVVRLDGSGLMRLTHNALEEGTPAWGAEPSRSRD